MQAAYRYAEMRDASRVEERALFPPVRTPNELELQARWFAGEFGKRFISIAGDSIEIVQFGIWNREAGPDFREACLRINGGEPITGCIEIDLLDRSWETHGHALNPAFEETILHVFVEQSGREFFSRTKSNRNVPQVRIDPSRLAGGFASIVPLARPGRCHAPLRDLSEDRVRSVLMSAAQFRLRKKAALIRNKIETHGPDEALFQELAAALGYKENSLPFTLLAQRLPLRLLRQNPRDIEAMVFGLAGFLEEGDLKHFEGSVRSYLRDLWDRWWVHRDTMRRMILPAKTWRLTATRPVNHPQRRLAALGVIARDWSAGMRAIKQARVKLVEDYFSELDHPFWNFHYTLASNASATSMALIGGSRTTEILANVLFPFWVSHDIEVWAQYAALPARLSNRRLETAATRLFGGDARQREFLKTVAHQQGLLQIYEDFCLQDNSDCAHCPFPEQMRQWR